MTKCDTNAGGKYYWMTKYVKTNWMTKCDTNAGGEILLDDYDDHVNANAKT